LHLEVHGGKWPTPGSSWGLKVVSPKINDRYFLNIRGYGALREFYGGALRPGKYKLTWMLVITFLELNVYFI
jgi:hypothetical protein